jgi:hypothetical protein
LKKIKTPFFSSRRPSTLSNGPKGRLASSFSFSCYWSSPTQASHPLSSSSLTNIRRPHVRLLLPPSHTATRAYMISADRSSSPMSSMVAWTSKPPPSSHLHPLQALDDPLEHPHEHSGIYSGRWCSGLTTMTPRGSSGDSNQRNTFLMTR